MNILIFSASTGGGHKRAAAALKEKIRSLSPETNVVTLDALKEIGRFYDKTVCGGYHFMATKAPKLFGKCYRLTDRKTMMYRTVMKSNTVMRRKLIKILDEYKPDVVIICHPFVTTMISKLKAEGKTDVKAISVITDYQAHRTYIAPNIDAYVVAEPQTAKKLQMEYGMNADKIYPLGIPVFDRFSDIGKKEGICKREGLDPVLPTVLLMAGSFGVSAVADFYKQLALSGTKLQLIVITGNNKKLYSHLEKQIEELESPNPTKLLFFVDNVEDYMHVSDIIVTKPGGLTVTESLASGLPMAFYSAFPGQEEDNAEFLTTQGAAIQLSENNGANQIVELLETPERLEEMKRNCQRLAIPNSVKNIFTLAKYLCGEKQE